MKNQLRLDLSRPAAYRPDAFVISPANANAVDLVLGGWRGWPSGAAALVGPEGSGKTHLSRLWLDDAGGMILEPPFAGSQGLATPVLIENVDRVADQEGLFHLLNHAAAGRTVADPFL